MIRELYSVDYVHVVTKGLQRERRGTIAFD
jgi:hypothetical protein